MGEFCGIWKRDSTLGTTREDILGDFLEYFEHEIEPRLRPGRALLLGICEGHGAGVGVHWDRNDGLKWFVHFSLGPGTGREVPAPVEIPPSTSRQAEGHTIRRGRVTAAFKFSR
ncbi:MAG: hypothetical protein HYZ28_18620 [Myxococcales bacterium]|nr:hypothetical protein [Myxococcales bacterium]